ncbi:MAG: Lrp/AsnC family transcriptional regulator [Aigarchaeota archaeon]|nr:Lrp/AsnC family transcriptional regulator [Aigarchaeota archaeon]MDW8092511.1 Lrp/AsnC family transcriptional regulator [Nitrososphaerota archaeon]
MPTDFDELDKKIIDTLKRDARTPVAQIAKSLSVPRTTVQERINRLCEKGVIKSFTVVTDYEKLGRSATAFVLVSFMPGMERSQREVAVEIAALENVQEVYLISGDWDILVKVRAGSISEIGRLVIDKIREIKGVSKTLTCAVFDTVKEEV